MESRVWSWPAVFQSGSITSCVTWECHSFTSGPQSLCNNIRRDGPYPLGMLWG